MKYMKNGEMMEKLVRKMINSPLFGCWVETLINMFSLVYLGNAVNFSTFNKFSTLIHTIFTNTKGAN